MRAGASRNGAFNATGGNVSFRFSHCAIPLVAAPTGTMANNGAITLGTAQATIYAQCYMLVPAGAIAAGVPAAADWYYCTMSSTTVGTVFNNLLSANIDAQGAPTIPASPTAFVTTGPGAFTGVTATTTAITLTVPASTIGTNGVFDLDAQVVIANTAGTRTTAVTFGGTSIHSSALASTTAGRIAARVSNRNSASIQSAISYMVTTANAVLGASNGYCAVNTGASVSVAITLTRATATDVYVLENFTAMVLQQ